MLEKQLCFPLYVASRMVTRLYQPLLGQFGLTYPQYVVLMILWEQSPRAVSEIGERAQLNSNTLTPLLKRLEGQGLITRTRMAHDERVVEISLTQQGAALEARCACVQEMLSEQVGLDRNKLIALKASLDEFLVQLRHLAP